MLYHTFLLQSAQSAGNALMSATVDLNHCKCCMLGRMVVDPVTIVAVTLRQE